jgi:polyisoprenoid-binding protein YceI
LGVSQFFNVNPAAMPPSGPKPGPWDRRLPRTWRAALDLPEAVHETRIPAGSYAFGPDNATLSLRTGRAGAAAKAGHDLLIHVTAWEATLEVGDDPGDTSVALDADGASLRVREGTGGMQALGDDDTAEIERTIHDEILKRERATFRSTEVRAGARGVLRVRGNLTLRGTTRPLEFDLAVAAGRALRAVAIVTQSDWGIEPYSTLFGALKVADEVQVEMAADLPAS